MDFKSRKKNRLPNYNYNNSGVYFITICTKDRKPILSKVVGTGVLDCPKIELLPMGQVSEQILNDLNSFYNHIEIDKYIIMPNHIHFLLRVNENGGQSGTPVPTNGNSVVSSFVSTFKRFCNKEYGENIWQGRFYDHIVRNEKDYCEIYEYIEYNVAKWPEDKLYKD